MKIRLAAAVALFALAGHAALPLTTIQDVLYKADGTRFNGSVTISWPSFEAMDASAIATQSTTIKIVDGNLRVQLAPTTTSTPAVYYTARYTSDGRVSFEESWSVPSSAQPVRLRDVRVLTSSVSAPSTGETGAVITPLAESGVTGLIADLGARPMKGPGYAVGRVAMVSLMGTLDSVVGSPTDCVRVDGSTGPCGGAAPSFVDADTLSGIVDGANRTFSLTATPAPPESLTIYRNGVLQKASMDFSADGRNIEFQSLSTPQPGDTLIAKYRLASTDAGSGQLYAAPQILCSGTGAAVNSVEFASVGTCWIPGGMLMAGDRVEIRFDLEHQGTQGGYTFALAWGASTVLQKDAGAADALASGRADAFLKTAGAQFSYQCWGSSLPFSTGVLSVDQAYTDGVQVDFKGKVAEAGEVLTLRGFSVVRVR